MTRHQIIGYIGVCLGAGGGKAPVFGNDEASGRRSSKVNKNRLLVKYKKIQKILKALPSIP